MLCKISISFLSRQCSTTEVKCFHIIESYYHLTVKLSLFVTGFAHILHAKCYLQLNFLPTYWLPVITNSLHIYRYRCKIFNGEIIAFAKLVLCS